MRTSQSAQDKGELVAREGEERERERGGASEEREREPGIERARGRDRNRHTERTLEVGTLLQVTERERENIGGRNFATG